MGEKYIKEENGKEVVYERTGIFDTKVGEVRESSRLSDPSGTKEIVDTSGLCGRVVGRIERESIFSDGREATINGEEGAFKYRGFLGLNQTFKPKERGGYESSPSNYSSSSLGGYSASSDSSSVGGLIISLGVLAAIIWGVAKYFKEGCAVSDQVATREVSFYSRDNPDSFYQRSDSDKTRYVTDYYPNAQLPKNSNEDIWKIPSSWRDHGVSSSRTNWGDPGRGFGAPPGSGFN